jgi:multimeric flavodoxin WrbA
VKLFDEENVSSEVIRVVDQNLDPAYAPLAEGEDAPWRSLYEKIKESDLLILGTPVTMGMCSSVAHIVLEKLNSRAFDADQMINNQFACYGKVAGVLITGTEDGAHKTAAETLYSLSRLGFTVPPNSAAYWTGPAGCGIPYGEADGERHFHTNKLLRFMARNCCFFAKLLANNTIPTDLNREAELAEQESTNRFELACDFTTSLKYRRSTTEDRF